VLFRSLLDAELVDDVELAVIPVLLGGGVPVLPEGIRHQLKLVELKRFPNGTLSLVYSAAPQSTPKSATTARNFKQSKTRPTPKSPNTKKRKP
jgi:dihydrofolate reductase